MTNIPNKQIERATKHIIKLKKQLQKAKKLNENYADAVLKLGAKIHSQEEQIKELEADKNILLSDISSIAKEIEADMEGEYTCDDIILNIQNINENYDELEIYNENLKCCGNCAKYDVEDCECPKLKMKTYPDQVCKYWDADLYVESGREKVRINKMKNNNEIYCKGCGVRMQTNQDYCIDCLAERRMAYINLLEIQIENLKCCGNCKLFERTNHIQCITKCHDEVCEQWVSDGLTKEEREE